MTNFNLQSTYKKQQIIELIENYNDITKAINEISEYSNQTEVKNLIYSKFINELKSLADITEQ